MSKLPFDVSEFDPAHSEAIADWSPGDGSRVSFKESEHLYKTEKGNYFVLTDGGLYSRFTEFPGAEVWFGGVDIQPLTEDEAVEWCESTGNYEVIDMILHPGG
jgi:hypothetical protein